MILRGALVLDLDPPSVRKVDVRVEDGIITEVGEGLLGDEVVDLHHHWLMPGLVVSHHHLYSALACGMPPAPDVPTSFPHMLELVWWRLDQALDLDAVHVSALVGGVAALRAGVTTIIDHHASPNAISGSLEQIDSALHEVGMRRILCYEVTDRHGPAALRQALRAHEGVLGRQGSWMAAMVGMHAGFTLSDASIRDCVALAHTAGVGVHIHAAEAVDDRGAVARLDRLGALLPGSILAHGVHLEDEELARVEESQCWITHQPRSNMNNAVGRAPIARFGRRTALGTDGIGGDMLAELQAGFFRANEDAAGWGPDRWCEALAAGARLAGSKLGISVGRIEPGYAADLVVLDAAPGPPLLAENLPASLIYRLSSALVRDVMVGGRWRLWNREPLGVTTEDLGAHARKAAERVWGRM